MRELACSTQARLRLEAYRLKLSVRNRANCLRAPKTSPGSTQAIARGEQRSGFRQRPDKPSVRDNKGGGPPSAHHAARYSRSTKTYYA
eukprot:6214673-Pleurochrysis_carterae.AAC.1